MEKKVSVSRRPSKSHRFDGLMHLDMKHLSLIMLIAGSYNVLFGQGDDVFPISVTRQFHPPTSVLWENPNDGSPSEHVLSPQGISAPVKDSHFGYTHPHFLGDASVEDTALIARSRALGPAYIRFPGGNGSNKYFWDGNLPVAILQDDVVTVDGLIDPDAFNMGIDELFQICDSTGAEPVLVVNFSFARYGPGDDRVANAAGYAADWVRHVNQTLGRNVRYWEIGNENYGPWQAGYMVEGEQITGTMYGEMFQVFADSMKSADPSIQLGAVIYPLDEDYDDWTAGVLPEVQNHADFLIVHDYFTFSPNENNISYSQMMASVSEVSEDAASVRSMVSQYTSKDPDHFALAFTEFNSNTGNREVAMANALFIARVLLSQIEEGFDLSMIWNLQSGVAPDGGSHGLLAKNSPFQPDASPRPTYLTCWLLQKYLGVSIQPMNTGIPGVYAVETMHADAARGGVLINTSSQAHNVTWDSPSSSRPYVHWDVLSAQHETSKLVMLNGIGPSSVEGGPVAPERMMSRGTLEPGAVIFTVPAYSILAFSRASALETETIVSCEPYTLNNQLYTSSALVSTYSLDSQTGIAVPSQYELLIAEPGFCSTEGCMDSNFLEFDPFAVADNGSCQTPVVLGCMYNEAANFNPEANVDDGSCSMIVDENCPEDLDGDGSVNTSDLLVLLSTFSAICQ